MRGRQVYILGSEQGRPTCRTPPEKTTAYSSRPAKRRPSRKRSRTSGSAAERLALTAKCPNQLATPHDPPSTHLTSSYSMPTERHTAKTKPTRFHAGSPHRNTPSRATRRRRQALFGAFSRPRQRRAHKLPTESSARGVENSALQEERNDSPKNRLPHALFRFFWSG